VFFIIKFIYVLLLLAFIVFTLGVDMDFQAGSSTSGFGRGGRGGSGGKRGSRGGSGGPVGHYRKASFSRVLIF
jgi:hypothetical protein